MQINQSTLANFFRSFKAVFMTALQGAEPQWPKIAVKMPSGSAEEVYAWLGAFPGMRKLVGSIVINNVAASDYRITNDEYEATIAVKEADIQRDRLGVYAPRMEALGVSAAASIDVLVAETLENGFTKHDYTGKPFFALNKKHEPGNNKSGVFSNLLTDPLSPTSYAKALAMLKGMKNSEGRSMGLGKKLQLVVPPALETMGKQILQADFIMQTAENGSAAAVSNVNKGTSELLVWPQLAGSDTNWFLIETGLPLKALIFQEEQAIALLALTSPESDHVFKHHEYLYQAYGRHAAGYGFPQLAVGSTGQD